MLFNYALTSLVLSAVAYASPINLDFAGQVNTDATGTDAISSANTASANASANATDTANAVGTGATSALPLGVSVNGVGTTAEQLETLQHTGENLRASLAALNISEADIDEIVPAILRLDVDGSGPSQFFLDNLSGAPAPDVLSFVGTTNTDGSRVTLDESLARIVEVVALGSSELQSHTPARWMISDGEKADVSPDFTGPLLVNNIVSMFAAAMGDDHAVQFGVDPSSVGGILSTPPATYRRVLPFTENAVVDRSFVLTVGIVPSDVVCKQVCTETQPCKAVSTYSAADGSVVCSLIGTAITEDSIATAGANVAAGGNSEDEQTPVSNSRFYNMKQ